MKKLVALLLIIGCLVTVFSMSVGAAGSSNEVDFIVKTDGENITVDVKTNFACGSLQGALKYDDDVSYDAISFETAIDSKNKVNDSVKNVTGATKFAFVGDVQNGTTGNWATVSYNGSKPKFDINSFKAYSITGELVDANVYIVSRGDANVDGVLNVKDLVAMKKISVNMRDIKEVYKKNIDVDNNGSWEPASDLLAFRKYLLNIYEF